MGRHRIEILIEADDANDALRLAAALYWLFRLIDGSNRSVRVIDVATAQVINDPT